MTAEDFQYDNDIEGGANSDTGDQQFLLNYDVRVPSEGSEVAEEYVAPPAELA